MVDKGLVKEQLGGVCAGTLRIGASREELLKAGFEYVEIVGSGADLNACKKVENQADCCSPATEEASPFAVARETCCTPAPSTLHASLTLLPTLTM